MRAPYRTVYHMSCTVCCTVVYRCENGASHPHFSCIYSTRPKSRFYRKRLFSMPFAWLSALFMRKATVVMRNNCRTKQTIQAERNVKRRVLLSGATLRFCFVFSGAAPPLSTDPEGTGTALSFTQNAWKPQRFRLPFVVNQSFGSVPRVARHLPPSTTRLCPVIKRASSEARNMTAAVMSCGDGVMRK